MNKKINNERTTQCIHHAGFRAILQVHRSLARAVTVDNEVATKTRTLNTLNVSPNRKKRLTVP